jgi:hypothetical protein
MINMLSIKYTSGTHKYKIKYKNIALEIVYSINS